MSKPRVVMIPKVMAALKPPHGTPCNRCGVCCWLEVCELGTRVLGVSEHPGPCPALLGSPGAAACGLIVDPGRFAPVQTERWGAEAMSAAAALIINAGEGCDARINGEPVNAAYEARLKKEQDEDALHAARHEHALALWKR